MQARDWEESKDRARPTGCSEGLDDRERRAGRSRERELLSPIKSWTLLPRSTVAAISDEAEAGARGSYISFQSKKRVSLVLTWWVRFVWIHHVHLRVVSWIFHFVIYACAAVVDLQSMPADVTIDWMVPWEVFRTDTVFVLWKTFC